MDLSIYCIHCIVYVSCVYEFLYNKLVLFYFQLFFELDGIDPLAMSYDWIAKKLYLSVRNGEQLMIYYLLDVGDIEDRDMMHVYTSEPRKFVESIQTELTIDPFKGLVLICSLCVCVYASMK